MAAPYPRFTFALSHSLQAKFSKKNKVYFMSIKVWTLTIPMPNSVHNHPTNSS